MSVEMHFINTTLLESNHCTNDFLNSSTRMAKEDDAVEKENLYVVKLLLLDELWKEIVQTDEIMESQTYVQTDRQMR